MLDLLYSHESHGVIVYTTLSLQRNTALPGHETHWTLDTGHNTLDTGHKTLDTGHKTLDTGRNTLDTRHNTLDTGHKTLDTGQKTLDTRHNTLDTGHNTLDTRHNTLDTTHWTLDKRHWTQHTGDWTQHTGHWTQDTGHWSLDTGHWRMIMRCTVDLLVPKLESVKLTNSQRETPGRPSGTTEVVLIPRGEEHPGFAGGNPFDLRPPLLRPDSSFLESSQAVDGPCIQPTALSVPAGARQSALTVNTNSSC
ncbi:hypothetical protein NHX12_020758 [Muraenolepis orangiensis]|uniref:Uncharacterized protein n=1 Tax=Muraenolepis orangiensis TaxID=630683 RepID=A0A9Q0EVW9_9TELE|nr:hypothetical protein NHX12_020758 [Muraenolepis orangiensis]